MMTAAAGRHQMLNSHHLPPAGVAENQHNRHLSATHSHNLGNYPSSDLSSMVPVLGQTTRNIV